jgi:hypothetical protein
MPNTVIMQAGPLTSAPAVFATEPTAVVGPILREFSVAQLRLLETATDQEMIDACAVFAAQRFHNYIRNWWRNKQIASSTDAIQKQNPIGEIAPPVGPGLP